MAERSPRLELVIYYGSSRLISENTAQKDSYIVRTSSLISLEKVERGSRKARIEAGANGQKEPLDRSCRGPTEDIEKIKSHRLFPELCPHAPPPAATTDHHWSWIYRDYVV
jgi:hypothetical protein